MQIMGWPAFWKAAATMYAAKTSADAQRDTNKANLEMNKQFAKDSIQWKVEDAKKAGIHPLYALGASTNAPTFAMKGHDYTGDAIRDIANQIPSDLQELQKKSVEADIALKMARTAEVAKRTQSLNSQQDASIVAEDNPKPRVKLHQKRQEVKTIIGDLMPDKQPGYIDANRIPERYGDEAKDFLGLIALWNDFWRNQGKELYYREKMRTKDIYNRFQLKVQKR